MQSIANIVRNKRFNLTEGASLDLYIESDNGTKYKLPVVNCSLRGLAASAIIEFPEDQGLVEGTILPKAMLRNANLNIDLGRLVLRARRGLDQNYIYGFQTIDTNVPIDGILSALLDLNDNVAAFDYEVDPKNQQMLERCQRVVESQVRNLELAKKTARN